MSFVIRVGAVLREIHDDWAAASRSTTINREEEQPEPKVLAPWARAAYHLHPERRDVRP